MDFNFAEHGTVESLDTVPEKYRGLYVEADGTFTVLAGAQGVVADYIGVSSTLAGVRVDKKKATDENAERRIATKAVEEFAQSIGLEVGDDGVALALKAFVDDLQGQVKGGKEIKINLDKVNGDWEKRFAELNSTKDGEVEAMRGALSKHLISDAASRALADAKGSIELLLPHVQAKCRVVSDDAGGYRVTVLDDSGDSRFDSNGALMGVAGLVSEMKTQDQFGRAFDSETKDLPGAATKPGSFNTPVHMKGNETPMTPVEKIREGLRKGQANQVGGTGSIK